MAQFKDPFRLEEYRDSLAKKNKLKELLKTYSPKSTEIKNINTADYWNKKFMNDRDSYKKNAIYKDKIKIVASIISEIKGKFLDIGMGFAYLEDSLRNINGLDLRGIDISKNVIDYARKNFTGEFKVGPILKIPFKNKQFEVVSALDVLEHIPPGKIFKAYSEVSRVLKNKGYFVISIPINEGLETIFKTGKNTGGHIRVYTPDLIKAELKVAGFKMSKIIYRSAFKKNYSYKTFIINMFPWEIRKPNMMIVVAQKI